MNTFLMIRKLVIFECYVLGEILKSRSEISSYIEQEYTVLEKTIRKNSGSHSLKVKEFSNVGIRRIIVSKAKKKEFVLNFGLLKNKQNS